MTRRKGDRVDLVAERRLAVKRARVLVKQEPHEISVEMWLSSYRGLFPDERTQKAREDEAHMLRPFRRVHGGKKMWEVTAMMAQGWALRHPGQVPWLRRAWEKAVLMQVAPVNVWRVVELPKRTTPRRRAPTDGEFTSILANCANRGADGWWVSYHDLVVVAAYTGARQGGLLALRRGDVDAEAGRMTVTEKGGKTRELVLCGLARVAMERQLAYTIPRLHIAHNDLGLRALVWRGPDHRELTPYRVQKAWRQVCGDFPGPFHCLRHYATAWLERQGVAPLDIAVQLGHIDAQGRPYTRLVERVYGHPEAADALERVARAVA